VIEDPICETCWARLSPEMTTCPRCGSPLGAEAAELSSDAPWEMPGLGDVGPRAELADTAALAAFDAAARSPGSSGNAGADEETPDAEPVPTPDGDGDSDGVILGLTAAPLSQPDGSAEAAEAVTEPVEGVEAEVPAEEPLEAAEPADQVEAVEAAEEPVEAVEAAEEPVEAVEAAEEIGSALDEHEDAVDRQGRNFLEPSGLHRTLGSIGGGRPDLQAALTPKLAQVDRFRAGHSVPAATPAPMAPGFGTPSWMAAGSGSRWYTRPEEDPAPRPAPSRIDSDAEPSKTPTGASSPAAEPSVATDLESSPAVEPADATDLESSPAVEPADATDLESSPSAEPSDATDLESSPAVEPADATDLESSPSAEPADATDLESSPAAEPAAWSSDDADATFEADLTWSSLPGTLAAPPAEPGAASSPVAAQTPAAPAVLGSPDAPQPAAAASAAATASSPGEAPSDFYARARLTLTSIAAEPRRELVMLSLTALGATMSLVSFFLPWAADNGLAVGTIDLHPRAGAYAFDTPAGWPLFFVLVLLIAPVLLADVIEQLLPAAARLVKRLTEVALPMLAGGILVGVSLLYLTIPWGCGGGLVVLGLGGMLLVISALVGLLFPETPRKEPDGGAEAA
jgi:hypothetical protein